MIWRILLIIGVVCFLLYLHDKRYRKQQMIDNNNGHLDWAKADREARLKWEKENKI